MALIKLGQGIIDIVGKLGSLYFHRDKSGLHLSKNPQRTSTATDLQLAQRSYFSQCTNAYVEHNWTSAESKAWLAFSKRHFTLINISVRKNPTVQNLFVGYNCVRLRNGLEIVFTPPDD